MAQTFPIDIACKIERRWGAPLSRCCDAPGSERQSCQRRALPGLLGYASIGPLAAEYCGKGLIHRHWLCRACDHEWITVLHVPT